MSENPHTLTTVTDPQERVIGLSCAAEGCNWALYGGVMTPERAEDVFRRQHRDQYEPGRVPDIAPEWVLSVPCSFCPDGGDVHDEGETLVCRQCDSTWYRDGTYGERAVTGA